MDTVAGGNKNKQNQTQTNRIETKTIQLREWSLGRRFNMHTPVIAIIAAGFFILFALPAFANDAPVNDSQTMPDNTASSAGSNINDDNQAAGDSTENAAQIPSTSRDDGVESSSSTSINIKLDTSTDGETTETEQSVKVNGEEIELPKNGRINEDIKSDNSRTRIRGRIDTGSDSNTSINISTDASFEMEDD